MRSLREKLGIAFLLLWAPLAIGIIGLLMVNHTVAMPSPTRLDRVEAALRTVAPDGHLVVHVIFAGCSCTDSLVDHLIARGADPSRREVVWFVGTMLPRHQPLGAAGYELRTPTAEELSAELDLKAAPLLFALRDGHLAYAGGYFALPAAVRPLDQQLLAALDDGEAADPLPVFGCAMDATLRRAVDPLGLQAVSRR